MILRVQPFYKKAVASLLLIAGLCASGVAVAAESDELLVPINRAELITVPGAIKDVVIASPDVADIIVHGDSKVSVLGKHVGTTSLRVLGADQEVLRAVTVRVTYDLPAIRQTLFQLFPYEDISVQTVNNNLALTGIVSSNAVASKAVQIVNEFLLPMDAVRPRPAGFNTPNDIARGGDTGVINMLKVSSGQQVMLRVRVGEMQRSAIKQLGLNWSASNPGNMAFGTGSLISTGPLSTPYPVPEDTFSAIAGTLTSGGATVTAMLDALERNNLFKLLAEPNLVAMSGEEAEFLAGGEFPIPVNAVNDTITIEFKQFGVSVRFLPQVVSDTRIRISVSPEISELTETGNIEIDGFSIPSLTTRRAKTTVELAPGESFMIAGLLRDQSDTIINQVPGLGEIPVLGALFRSTAYQRNETELVIAVTPYLVDPVTGDEVRLPTDNFRQPSVMEQFFYGALSSLSGDARRVSQTPSLEGPIGFMVD